MKNEACDVTLFLGCPKHESQSPLFDVAKTEQAQKTIFGQDWQICWAISKAECDLCIQDDIHTYEVVSIAIPTDPCFSEKPDEEQSKNNIRHLIIEGFARE